VQFKRAPGKINGRASSMTFKCRETLPPEKKRPQIRSESGWYPGRNRQADRINGSHNTPNVQNVHGRRRPRNGLRDRTRTDEQSITMDGVLGNFPGGHKRPGESRRCGNASMEAKWAEFQGLCNT